MKPIRYDASAELVITPSDQVVGITADTCWTLWTNHKASPPVGPVELRDVLASCRSDGVDNVIGTFRVNPPWKDDEISRSEGSVAIVRAQLGGDAEPSEPFSMGFHSFNGLSLQSDGTTVWLDSEAGRVLVHDSTDEVPLRRGKDGSFTFAQAVQYRNKLRRRARHTVVPGVTSKVMRTTLSNEGRKSERRPSWLVNAVDQYEGQSIARRKVGTRVEVGLSDATERRLNRDGSQLQLWREFEIGEANDLAELAMSTIRHMTPECALCAMGVAAELFENGNRPTQVTMSSLAAIRGFTGDNRPRKRSDVERFKSFADLILNWRIVIRTADGKTAEGPLFTEQWTVDDGTERTYRVTLNADVYEAMKGRGHGFVIPRQLLQVSVKDDWTPRLGVYLAERFNLNWVARLHEGNPLSEKCATIVERSGIVVDFEANRRKCALNGDGSVRRRMASALDELKRVGTVDDWMVNLKDDPRDDVYRIMPGRDYADAMNDRRLPALEANVRRRSKRARKARSGA